MMADETAEDDAAGLEVKPGEAREMTHTFVEAGQSIAGCHERPRPARGGWGECRRTCSLAGRILANREW